MAYGATLTLPTITGSHSNFPVVLRAADFPAAAINGGGTSIDNGGGNLRAYTSSAKTTQLPIDVVTFVTGGTPDIEVWVKVPTAATGNTIYVEADGTETAQPAVTDPYGRNAVWDYCDAVYHCAEASGDLVDSTGNGYSATPQNGPGYGAAGQIGDAVTVANSGSKYFDAADAATLDLSTLSTGYAIRLIINLAASQPDWGGLLMKGTSGNDWGLQRDSSTGDMRVIHAGSYVTATDGFGDLAGAGWKQVYITWDKSTLRYYVGGVLHSSIAQTTAPGYSDTYTLKLGAERTGLSVNADLDEVMIALEFVPDADWIATEDDNQFASGNWVSVGAWVSDGDITLLPDYFDDQDTFYPATLNVSHTLLPSYFDDQDTFYPATLNGVSPDVTLLPGMFIELPTFYTATLNVTHTLNASLFTDTDDFFAAQLNVNHTLLPSYFDDADVFYPATLNVSDSVTLLPDYFDDQDVFYSATLNVSHTLLSSYFDDADVFYPATVNIAHTLYASLFTDTDTSYPATLNAVSPGDVTLLPAYFDDPDIFYPATVNPGVTLTAGFFADTDTFYAHMLNNGDINVPLSRTLIVRG